MQKTTVYLSEQDQRRLQAWALRTGKSQSEIIRDAIAAYGRDVPPDRDFAMAGCHEGDGTSVADASDRDFAIIGVAAVPGLSAATLSDDDLFKGFGE
jgi:predicted DNA-binding protein